MFTKIYSVDNFYTAKLTKILKLSALALYKNITNTAVTRYKSGFRRGFQQWVLTTVWKSVGCKLTTREIRDKVKNYQQKQLFFHKIFTVFPQICNLETENSYEV